MSIDLDSQSPKLFSILASISGKKDLVLDQSLSLLISSLASFTQLQDHGIESVKWLAQTQALETGPSRVLIIARPQADAIRRVATLVKRSKGKEFVLLLVPRRTLESDAILEREGVLSDIDIKLLPVIYNQEEPDLIRVDAPLAPYSTPIVSPAELFQVANSLVDLQRQFGRFSRIRGKGINVATVTDVTSQLSADLRIEEKETLLDGGSLGECIILDRTTDLITPLLTQLTYEGLLRESYTMTGSVLDLPAQVASTERKLQLDHKDSVFEQLRGENFARVGPQLSQLASSLSQDLDARHGLTTTSELKHFVSRMPNLQTMQKSLRLHIELTELLLAQTKSLAFRGILEIEQSLYGGFAETEIISQVESLIALDTPCHTVLRLLSLWSCVHNGLKAKDIEFFTTRLVQRYGEGVLMTLHRLSDAGLWVVRSPTSEKGRGAWNGFSRAWKLCPDEYDESKDPSDLAYLYAGYAPLNLRILEGYLGLRSPPKEDRLAVLGGGTKASFDSLLSQLRGPSVDLKHVKPLNGQTTVVVFLGGCCATELAGVRFLMKQTSRPYCIVTHSTIHGKGIMQQFIESVKS